MSTEANETVVNETVEAVEEVVEEQKTLEDTLDSYIKEVEEKFKEIKGTLSKLKQFKKEVRAVEIKLRKTEEKKKKKNNKNKKLSGFNIPTQISNELITFFKKNMDDVLNNHVYKSEDTAKTESRKKKIREQNEKDRLVNAELLEKLEKLDTTEGNNKLARTDVTRLLTRFLRYHNLQNATHKKMIQLDDSKESEAFKKLLSTDDYENITFFNMQKKIKHHFYKKDIGGFPEKVGEELPTESIKPTPPTAVKKRRVRRKTVAA